MFEFEGGDQKVVDDFKKRPNDDGESSARILSEPLPAFVLSFDKDITDILKEVGRVATEFYDENKLQFKNVKGQKWRQQYEFFIVSETIPKDSIHSMIANLEDVIVNQLKRQPSIFHKLLRGGGI